MTDLTKATLLEIANGCTLEAPFDRDKFGWKAFVKARDRAKRKAGPDGIALERTADLLHDYGFEAEAAVLRGTESVVAQLQTTLREATEVGHEVSSLGAQVAQHERAASQQLAAAKQASADIAEIAAMSREMRPEIDAERDALQKLTAQVQRLSTTTESTAKAQREAEAKEHEEFFATTSAELSTLRKSFDESIERLTEKATADLESLTGSVDTRVTEFVSDTSTRLATTEAARQTAVTRQLREFTTKSDAAVVESDDDMPQLSVLRAAVMNGMVVTLSANENGSIIVTQKPADAIVKVGRKLSKVTENILSDARDGEMAAEIAHEVKNPVPPPLTFLESLEGGWKALQTHASESKDLTQLAALGEMAAEIAHEVKNPVPPPLTFLESLDGGWKALQRHASLQKI